MLQQWGSTAPHALSPRSLQPPPPPCREELAEYDPFDDGSYCRSRFWLFVSYMVSFASIVGAVWVLLQHYGACPAA